MNLVVSRESLEQALDAVLDRLEDFAQEIRGKYDDDYSYSSSDLARAVDVLEALLDGRPVEVSDDSLATQDASPASGEDRP